MFQFMLTFNESHSRRARFLSLSFLPGLLDRKSAARLSDAPELQENTARSKEEELHHGVPLSRPPALVRGFVHGEGGKNTVVISSVAGGLVILVVLFITCCCCPCCCMYQMCRKPRPVVGTHVTAITNTSVIQQPPAAQGIQYSQYQPVPNQPGYAHPMQTAPYQGQPYAPGPPPPYHVAMSPGYPTSQYAYDGGQAVYPTQPPAQPAPVYMPPETSSQPAYNPAYVQPPKTTY
ncbi:uncharacterized protein LOC122327508 isoform X1 [Puntigrus tetrazona]|uniref:uncharacterized protein LOC122327508 isoform X1 n=1 Tax=Puntigrus tetrazona TaxID=1606681 RepID=UPI001C8964A7|nr:uncharacterized protein LOC122327508 isoform X1 [Puntigrus tetrazona]